MKCWKCGQEIAGGAGSCPYCGAEQARSAPASEVGRALRALYDRYGCQTLLRQNEILVRGLGDLVQDSKKIRNQLRLALESGMGRLYLEQLKLAGRPDDAFYQRVRLRLTGDAGLAGQPAAQLMGWFDEMIGWAGEPSRQQTRRPAPAGGVVIGIDLGASFIRAAVLQDGKPVIIPTPEGGRCLPSVVGVLGDRFLIGREAQQQMLRRAGCAVPVIEELGAQAPPFTLDGRSFPAQLLLALLLRRVRQNAEAGLGRPVEGAVIAVPGKILIRMRQAVLDAAKIAGLPVRRLISAPSAAALAYSFEHPEDRQLLLCNLGGLSLDIAAVEIDSGVTEVLAHSGNRRVGGAGLDERIARWMADAFRGQTGLDITSDRLAMTRLKDAAERARREVSELTSSRVFVPYITAAAGRNHDLDMTLTRSQFDELAAPVLEDLASCIERVLGKSGLDRARCAGVLLVGGVSRTPAFRETVRKASGMNLIQRLHPDECTALGAALLAGTVTGKSSALLIDVNAYSLGIETDNGAATILIPANTALPIQRSMEFSTVADNQATFTVHLLEGGSQKAADNASLGRYEIKGIPPAKKGVPRIKVTLEVDTDGMLKASAAEQSTGKTWRLDVGGAVGMDGQTIREMARRAEQALP